MQQAAVPGYRLSRSRHSTKILTSLGLVGLFLGLLSAALLTLSRTGITPSEVNRYYRGEAVAAGSLDQLMAEIPVRRSFAELADVTHLHLTGGSILLFLLCHLLALCDISERLRITLYLVGFLSFITTFASPWLIVYLSPKFAWLFGPAIVTFICSLFCLMVLPLKEMWCSSASK